MPSKTSLVRARRAPRWLSYLVASGALCLGACGGGGPYNFSRQYHPLKAERPYFEATEQQFTYEDVKRDPNRFAKIEFGWFGVVTGFRENLRDGQTRLTLSLRVHQARHLCGNEQSSSCRVTVGSRDLGTFVVTLRLTEAEKYGVDRVGMGSLFKVYGTTTSAVDNDGNPILKVSYYRHFPRDTYVTPTQRGSMRR